MIKTTHTVRINGREHPPGSEVDVLAHVAGSRVFEERFLVRFAGDIISHWLRASKISDRTD